MTLLSQRTVTTRKPHKCFGCLRTMPAGSRMTKMAATDEGGEFCAYYVCETCMECISRWDVDFYCEGELRMEGEEHWEEVRQEIEGQEAKGGAS